MKRVDFRIILGVLLVLGGLLGLLDKFGIFPASWKAADLFWGAITGAAGLFFLYTFITEKNHWWAAIPAATLLGMSAASFLPESLSGWDGLAFMGGVSLGFWLIYATGRERWWAIIPAGVLLTLGLTSLASDIFGGVDTGGLFFIGIGLTFLLTAILPPAGRTWAYIPAAVLLVLGAVLGTPFAGVLDYVWIAGLFVGGAALIWQFLRKN